LQAVAPSVRAAFLAAVPVRLPRAPNAAGVKGAICRVRPHAAGLFAAMPTPKKSPTKRKAETAGGGAAKRQATSGAGGDVVDGGAAELAKAAKPAKSAKAEKPAAIDVAGQLSAELGVEEWRVRGAMKLFADGATLPFVARSVWAPLP